MITRRRSRNARSKPLPRPRKEVTSELVVLSRTNSARVEREREREREREGKKERKKERKILDPFLDEDEGSPRIPLDAGCRPVIKRNKIIHVS